MEKLHLEDALEDSPQTQNLLGVFEKDAMILRNYVVTLLRCYNRVLSAHRELCFATQSLSLQLKSYDQQGFPLESDESILSTTLSQFSVYVDELSSMQQVLSSQLGDCLFPLNKFLQADLDEILTIKEVFQSSRNEHERSLSAYMRYSKKKDQDKSRFEVNDDLYVSRKKFHQTAMHYYSALNSLQYKRKSAILEPLIGLVQSHKTYLEMGKEAILKPDTEDFIANMSASVQGVQQELKQSMQQTVEQIETIEELGIHRYYAEPVPDMPVVQPDVTLAQKAGYLFLRIKPSLLSTARWDRCYFFIQGGNLMCQAKDEVAGSPIVDLDEQTLVETTEADDRRFLFQVYQPTCKKSVILQAENMRERDEWMAAISNAAKNGRRHSSQSGSSSGQMSPSTYQRAAPLPIPKVLELAGESLATGRSSHPPTPSSTPAEGSFFPDAPIQFDIITPCEEAAKNFPESKEGPPKRINPFDQTSCTSLSSSEQAGFLCDYEVRFLGSQQVKTDRGEQLLRETIRQIMAARAIHNIFKMTEVRLVITDRLIRLQDVSTNNIITGFTLEDVSYWAIHNDNKRLFGFITRTKGTSVSDRPTFTCHVFECNTSGEEICRAIATATQMAFQIFMQQKADEMGKTKETELVLENIQKLDEATDPTSSPDGRFLILDQSDGLFPSSAVPPAGSQTTNADVHESAA